MKKFCTICLLLLAGLWINGSVSWAQVLLDDFNRPDNSTVGNGWSEISTAFFSNQSRITDQALRIEAGNSSADFVHQNVSSRYNTVFRSNPNVLTWAINMRQTLANPNGFNSTSNLATTNGIAFILGVNSVFFFGNPNGYAVVLGQPGELDRIRLVRINGQIGNSALSDIVAGGDYSSEFLSIRVTYDPATERWSLYVEANPTGYPRTDPTQTSTLIGTNTDNTYTGSNLSILGVDWHHSGSPNDYATFDNIYIPDNQAPLPVRLTAFNARREGPNVRLNWQTASETNNAGFEVQRSTDLQEFISLGFVNASTANNVPNFYTFVDESHPQASYYRLKQLDHNGDFVYSNPIFVKEPSWSGFESLVVYPNPTTGKIHLSLPEKGEKIQVTLFSLQGVRLVQLTALPQEAETRLSATLDQAAPGLYLLHIDQGSHRYQIKLEKH